MVNFTEKLKQLKERLTPLLKNRYFLIAVGALIVMFIAVSFGKSDKTEPESTDSGDISFDAAGFEDKLEDILSDIKGVRSASVLLSLESGSETVYAVDISESVSGERTTVSHETVISGGEAVKVKSLFPKFSGAVVVYTGTESASVRLNLMNAVSSATGLSSDKITVLYGG